MNAGKHIILAALACAFLCGCAATAETPAQPPAQLTDLKPIADPHDPVNEEDPVRLRAISCQMLDLVMSANYAYLGAMDVSKQVLAQRGFAAADPAADRTRAAPYVRRFKAERKEYKSRCKGPATELEAVKKKYPNNPYIPNA